MNKVNQNAIKRLLETEDAATLSIYLPTHRFPTPEHMSEDKIRFKNLLRMGKEALVSRGVDDGIVTQMVHTLETEVYENDSFWQESTEGMAVFCSPAGMHYFHLPMECSEWVHVGDRYDITPLLAIASYDQPYYILALATRNPVLYKGDMYGVEQVAIELPESPEVALNIDESHSNSKTDRAGGYVGSKAHGQGDSKQAGQEERLKFFRLVDDKILSDAAVNDSLPFLLAGANDEISGYRDVSRLRHLLEDSLNGNYTEVSVRDIHAKSWPLIDDELCNKARAEEIEKVNSLVGTGKASAGAENIAAAAADGKVDTLLVGVLVATRDTVSDGEESVTKLSLPEDYDANDMTVCGRAVFDQGGQVLAIPREALPDNATVAALYRY